MHQDGCLGKGTFEGVKCSGVVRSPGERGVLVGEMNQRDDNIREPHNESVVEVHKAKECLNCFEVARVGQALTTLVLAVSIEMPSGVTVEPKNSIFWVWNRHFLGFKCKSYLHRQSRTHQM